MDKITDEERAVRVGAIIRNSMYRVAEDKVEKQAVGQVVAPAAPAKAKWYDFLERLVPYRDVVMLAGAGLVVAGVWMYDAPAGLIVSGAFAIYGARMMAVK